MSYVDGFVLAVPTANKDAYIEMATKAGAVFKDHGAIQFVECWGDDVPEGEVTSFTLATKRQPDETAVFSWIVWPSKEARDAGMAKVMADPRLDMNAAAMPFDGKRMFFGGFAPVVEL